MRLRWTKLALADLEAIWRHIVKDNPQAADGVEDRIVDAAANLRQFPGLGRVGLVEGTRELVVPGLPYIIVYAAKPGGIVIYRVRHGKRLWPPP